MSTQLFLFLSLLSSCIPQATSPTASTFVTTTAIPLCKTGIPNTGASGIYFSKDAPFTDVDPTAPKICVVTASGQIQCSSASGRLRLPTIPEEYSHSHVMPRLPNMLIDFSKFCEANCTVFFNKTTATVLNPAGDTILAGWRDKTSPQIWNFHILPKPSTNPLQQASYAPAAKNRKSLSSIMYECLSEPMIYPALNPLSTIPMRIPDSPSNQLD